MKKYIKISLLFLLPISLSAQHQLINNGAIIKVQNGTNLRVDNGGIVNKDAGTIDNNGNVYLDANYNQATGAVYAGSATSWLWFEGASNENITGDAPLDIAKLRVDNGNRLVLGNHVNVALQADLFNNGDIELGNFNLLLASGAAMSGYDANNYVITNGSGFLQREVAAAAVDFPVGISNYNPATLSNSGTSDHFQVRLEDFARVAYPAGTVETEGAVGRAWHINEQTVGGSLAVMTLQWESANELLAFDRTQCGISHWTGTAWDPSPAWTNSAVAGTGWSQTRTAITSFSPFIVEDNSTQLPIELLAFEAERSTNIKVALEWSTESEHNNKGFWVERMLHDETEFKTVAWVDGYGSSNEIRQYDLLDNNSSREMSYYRLLQVDFDGTESLSEVRAVEGSEFNELNNVTLFPLPVDDVLNVRFTELPQGVQSADFNIYNLNGQLINSVKINIKDYQHISLNFVKDLIPGSYLLTIKLDNGEGYTEKFVKM